MASLLTAAPAADAASVASVPVERKAELRLQGLPLELMSVAQDEMAHRNPASASGMLRALGLLLAAQMTDGADPGGRRGLKKEIDSLKGTLKDLHERKIKDARELGSALANVALQESRRRRLNASAKLDHGDYRGAGFDLMVSADAMEFAAGWSESKLERSGGASMRSVRALSAELVAGRGWTGDEVRKAMNVLDESPVPTTAVRLDQASRP